MFTIRSFARSVMISKRILALLLFLTFALCASKSFAQDAVPPSDSTTETGTDDAAVTSESSPAAEANDDAEIDSPTDKAESTWKVAFYATTRPQTLLIISQTETILQLGLDVRGSLIILPIPEFGLGLVGGAGYWWPSAWKAGTRRPAIQVTELGFGVQVNPGDLGIRANFLGALATLDGTQLHFIYPAIDLDVSYRFPDVLGFLAIGLSSEVAFRQDPGPTIGFGLTLRIGGVAP